MKPRRSELNHLAFHRCSVAAHVALAGALLAAPAVHAAEGELHLSIIGTVILEVEAPTPAPAVEAPAPRAVLEEDRVRPLDGLRFETDRVEPVAASLAALEAVAEVALSHPSMRLRVEAHADDAASSAYNLDLSQRRAAWVSRWLVRHGVPPTAVSSEGFGASRPVADNRSVAGRRLNRRVEFVIAAR